MAFRCLLCLYCVPCILCNPDNPNPPVLRTVDGSRTYLRVSQDPSARGYSEVERREVTAALEAEARTHADIVRIRQRDAPGERTRNAHGKDGHGTRRPPLYV